MHAGICYTLFFFFLLHSTLHSRIFQIISHVLSKRGAKNKGKQKQKQRKAASLEKEKEKERKGWLAAGPRMMVPSKEAQQ
jgi:hypothetical protein